MRTALRFRRIPRTIATLAAAGALALTAGTAGAQVSSGDIAQCVRDNLVKYAPPDRAVIDQYLSIEAACQAYLEGDGGAQISVSPSGGAGGGGGANGATGGGAGAGAGTTSGGGTATTPGGGAPATGSGPGGGSRGEARGAAPGGGDAVVLKASARIPAADAGSPAAVSAVSEAPLWLIGILVLVVAGVVSAIVMGARRRTR